MREAQASPSEPSIRHGPGWTQPARRLKAASAQMAALRAYSRPNVATVTSRFPRSARSNCSPSWVHEVPDRARVRLHIERAWNGPSSARVFLVGFALLAAGMRRCQPESLPGADQPRTPTRTRPAQWLKPELHGRPTGGADSAADDEDSAGPAAGAGSLLRHRQTAMWASARSAINTPAATTYPAPAARLGPTAGAPTVRPCGTVSGLACGPTVGWTRGDPPENACVGRSRRP